jgi:hypothetical protein
MMLANGRKLRGDFLSRTGSDPATDWRRSEEAFAEALRLHPANPLIWKCRGDLRWGRSEYLKTVGDPGGSEEARAAAARDYEEAVRLDPSRERELRDRLRRDY